MKILVAVALTAIFAGSAVAAPLKAGDKAPDFTAPLSDGSLFTLRANLSKAPIVLYFYPKDFTPGCTKGQRRLMPLFARGWIADYPDAHNFIYAFYHSQGRYPASQGFSDPELDAMIASAVAEPSPAKRNALYKKILARGYEDCPTIFTVHPAGVYALRTWVSGFVDNPVNLGIYYYPIEKK